MFIYLFLLNKTSWSQNLKVITNLKRKKNREECLKYRRSQVSCFHPLILQNHLCGVAVVTDMATRKKNEHCGDYLSCKVFSCFPKCMSVSF